MKAKTLFDRCRKCERGVYMVDTEDDPTPGSWCTFCGDREPIYMHPKTGRPVEEQYAHLDLSNRRIEIRPETRPTTRIDKGGRPGKSLTAKQKAKRDYMREYMRQRRAK